VAKYYPGLQTGITAYNWGAEGNINGATTQADILGIFGVQGLDIATRWEVPDPSTPTYKAMKLYRNYDGVDSTFGDISVSATGPNPDNVAVYAATRSYDNRLTVMVINKQLNAIANLSLTVKNFESNDSAQVWQLTSANAITRLCDVPVPGGVISTPVPPQSITLFVVQPSNVTESIPAAPTGLTATAGNGKVVLSWNTVSGAMEYDIYRSLSATGGFAKIGRATGTTFTDLGVVNQTPYYYNLVAANINGSSSHCVAVEGFPFVSDTAQYNFETGTQDWTCLPIGGMLGSIDQSTGEAFMGTHSLAVNINATGSQAMDVYVDTDDQTLVNSVPIYHVWIPMNCKLSSVYVEDSWEWMNQWGELIWTATGATTKVTNMVAGQWNTLQCPTPIPPANARLFRLYVEFDSNQSWAGTCYIDSVSW
jgi:hypothetical protein